MLSMFAGGFIDHGPGEKFIEIGIFYDILNLKEIDRNIMRFKVKLIKKFGKRTFKKLFRNNEQLD